MAPPEPVRPAPPPADAPVAPAVTAPERARDCAPCQTQEDFDAAWDNSAHRSRCCPVTACEGDSDCPGARVCCRIPNGQLCADALRCAKVDRVQR